MSYTQAVSYLAGCLGCFARFARDGELEFEWYKSSGITIGRNNQKMGGLKRTTDRNVVITSLNTGTAENPIVKGEGENGTSITFENPFITDEISENIFESLNGLSYAPCTLAFRGNPAIQSGDIIQAIGNDSDTLNLYVMSYKLKISGGCSGEIESKGTSETTSALSSSFKSGKINRIYKQLEQSILDATNKITGNNGGYVILHDVNQDGNPDEILILDTQKIDTAQNVWRWNKEGLGHSSNGYNGPYALAMTADGKINADMVQVGTLSAEFIAVEKYNEDTKLLTDYIHFEDGSLTFGSAESQIILKIENDQIVFYNNNKKIGVFTSNSFEVDNLENGKIRFQNFQWITRSNNNLSFTLVQEV